MAGKKKNFFPYRNVTISWNQDAEAMLRYAYKELWPIDLPKDARETGRSLYCHAAISFYFMFLQWCKDNKKDVPVEFFENLYSNNFNAPLSELKKLYRGFGNDYTENSTARTKRANKRGGTKGENPEPVQEGQALES